MPTYKDPTKLVQYWRNGIMIGRMPKTVAQQLLAQGEAYFITKQAIGAIIDGKKAG